MRKTLKELAELTSAIPKGDLGYVITGVNDLKNAGPNDVSFLSSSLYVLLFKKTEAGVVCVAPSVDLSEGRNYLISTNPSLTFGKIVDIFLSSQRNESGFRGVHETAVIHPTAFIGDEVTLAPYVVVDADCKIGRGSKIGPFVSLGRGVEVGSHSVLHAHVTIREGCKIGERVIIQPSAVIGSCGFGYITNEKGVHHKQEHFGIVVIEDDVEIGAGTTIDRALFKETRIGQGSKVDNLVQIAHNVELGAHNLIVSQTGISGSVKTGRNVVMGGQTGVVGHVNIADGAMFAARAGINKSVQLGGKYGGNPITPLKKYQRCQVIGMKLDEYLKRIQSLEKQLAEKKIGNG